MKNVLTLALIFTFSLMINQAFGQVKSIPGKKATKENISKYQLPTTDVVAQKPDNTRGVCCLDFDNYTGYTLFVWVDNVYRGTVSPWDLGGVCVESGYTKWYVRTAGSTYEWWNEGQCRDHYTLTID